MAILSVSFPKPGDFVSADSVHS